MLLITAAISAALSFWPQAFIALPPLLLGYTWTRTLRESSEILRTSLLRNLRHRVPSWILTWAAVGAVFAALMAFSLMRLSSDGTWSIWLRGGLPPLILLLASAIMAWQLRKKTPRSNYKPNQTLAWFDFPGLELLPYQSPDNDARVIEIAYEVHDENIPEFFKTMIEIERIRYEEGAAWWTFTRNDTHPNVYHEFFRVESWQDYQLALKEECDASRELKQLAFSLNDWESMPTEINYPAFASCLSFDGQARLEQMKGG